MMKIAVISLQFICLLGALLVLKLISYVHISDIGVCCGGILIVSYPLLLRLLLHKKYTECGKNDLEQIKYILVPLFCAEIFMIIFYWQDVLALLAEFMQVNQWNGHNSIYR